MRLLVCFIFWLCYYARAYRILGIFPMPAPSHYFLGSALMKGLANRGHDVTIISPFIEKDLPLNGSFRSITIENLFTKTKNQIDHLERTKMSSVRQRWLLNNLGLKVTEFFLEQPKVHILLNSQEHFDLVIIEQFQNDALKGIADHFKAPFILLSTLGANAWINTLVGNPAPPSFIPELLLTYPNKMSFLQRVRNSVEYVIGELNRALIFYPKQAKIYYKYFPNGSDFYHVLYNASMVFLNSHVSTNPAVPSVPNIIDIGGYHVSEGKRSLPEDLHRWLKQSEDGVIYFSLGSNMNSTSLPRQKIENLLKTFGKLKQRVLWKWDGDTIPNKPPNVETRKWVPQQAVLEYPEVRLFITHGGLLSTIEAIYFGKPMVTIPIFGDQKMNAAMAEINGYSITVNILELSEEKLTNAIERVLDDRRYQLNVQKRARIMHDRPMSPMDTAVFWTEYVIRHQGASHLRTYGAELKWYEYILLDVLVFLLFLLLLMFCLLYFTFKILYNFIKHEKRFSDKPKTS